MRERDRIGGQRRRGAEAGGRRGSGEGDEGRWERGSGEVERRDGKRSACRVLFSGVGKAGERQARTAARDECERWGWWMKEGRGGGGGEGWSSSIPDASMPEVSMLPYYVIASMM